MFALDVSIGDQLRSLDLERYTLLLFRFDALLFTAVLRSDRVYNCWEIKFASSESLKSSTSLSMPSLRSRSMAAGMHFEYSLPVYLKKC